MFNPPVPRLEWVGLGLLIDGTHDAPQSPRPPCRGGSRIADR